MILTQNLELCKSENSFRTWAAASVYLSFILMSLVLTSPYDSGIEMSRREDMPMWQLNFELIFYSRKVRYVLRPAFHLYSGLCRKRQSLFLCRVAWNNFLGFRENFFSRSHEKSARAVLALVTQGGHVKRIKQFTGKMGRGRSFTREKKVRLLFRTLCELHSSGLVVLLFK